MTNAQTAGVPQGGRRQAGGSRWTDPAGLDGVRGRLRYLLWRLAEPPGFMSPVVVLSTKVALASGLAWALGQAFNFHKPFDAVLAVVILMQGNAYGSLLNSLQFLLGVVAGLFLGLLAIWWLGLSAPVVAGTMFVGMIIGGWLKLSRLGFNNQIAVSALLVLASGSNTNIARLWETAIGGAVGVAVAALLWPPNPVRGIRQEFRQATQWIKSDVLRTLQLAGFPDESEASRRDVRAHSERADAAVATVGPAEDALRWNPWHSGRMHDLSQLEDGLRLISYLYRTVRALARQGAETPRPEPGQPQDWDRARPHLVAAAGAAVEAIDRRLRDQDVDEPVRRGREEVVRFTAAAPGERHAVALAAALEDLLTDIGSWHAPNQVDPDRQLVARVVRRLGGRLPRSSPTAQAAVQFEEERQDALVDGLTSMFTRRPKPVPPMSEVVKAAGVVGEADKGFQEIPMARIKGSEKPLPDFNASFLPRRRRVQQRWTELLTLMEKGVEMQPIRAYQVGDVYFVRDGHARVSVARHLGWETIRGEVTEVLTRAHLGSDINPEQLLRAEEYTRFLDRTQLDRTRPEARLECGQLGHYDSLFDHVLGHRYFLGIDRGSEVSTAEAAASWYDLVYKPLIDLVCSQDLDERLPGWTDTDIYVALTKIWLDLDEEGQASGAEGAASKLLTRPPGGRNTAQRLPSEAPPPTGDGLRLDRTGEILFRGPVTRLARRPGRIERAVIWLTWLCDTPTLTAQKDLLQRIAVSAHSPLDHPLQPPDVRVRPDVVLIHAPRRELADDGSFVARLEPVQRLGR
ncbi:FUSC family protein [Candidatus Nephthysia bennettiae]|uniref:FUSC family protein n=1 Tax=Candidatus Nephthysia bennettiae TaxID=3127016 RepID=A0A934KE56_9BACT|nr:FUSC family protein [Candidatus Dormibacteraeota bacterium]